jgi:hypothetical protein
VIFTAAQETHQILESPPAVASRAIKNPTESSWVW